jgi:hypothetical protein
MGHLGTVSDLTKTNERLRLEALEFQSIVDRAMPGHAEARRREESARIVAAGEDFRSPDWTGLALHSVMSVREAVALSCSIHRRHAWVIEHRVGEGAVLAAIKEARERMEYLEHGLSKSPDEKVPLEFLVGHAQRLRWDLPVGFPHAAEAPAPKQAIRWTDDFKAEVRAYREAHGLKATAKRYGVSQALISRYVPAGKPTPEPHKVWRRPATG